MRDTFDSRDERLPLPDVRGHLADLQIRNFASLAAHVRENWPNVAEVRIGIRDDIPYFTFHLQNFSQEQQQATWPLGDWIKEHFQLRYCECFFQPADPVEDKSLVIPFKRHGIALDSGRQ